MSAVLGVSLSVGQNEAILKQHCVSQWYVQIVETMDSKEMRFPQESHSERVSLSLGRRHHTVLIKYQSTLQGETEAQRMMDRWWAGAHFDQDCLDPCSLFKL